MASIDEILKEFTSEVSDETKRYSSALQTNVSRDSIRRPWNRPTTNQPSAADKEERGELREVWFESMPSILSALKKHGKTLAIIFGITLAIILVVAGYLPSMYNSSLHLYAPEKTDSISSRLNLFSNRVEFASFPVDFKIPLGLVARRLRDEAAKEWVLRQYAAKTNKSDERIVSALVHADTFYADGSELLVIQGYANSPQIAADITNLYWDYLENEIGTMRREHLRKIDQWISLTSANLQQRTKQLGAEVGMLAGAPLSESRVHLNGKLAEAYSDVELKRLQLQRELTELKKASASKSTEDLWAISNSEIQDLKMVYQALEAQGAVESSEALKQRRADIKRQAMKLAHSLLEERQNQYVELQDESNKLKSQLDAHSIAGVSDHQRALLRQQADYQAQVAELEKLRAQIGVESTLTPSRLRVIQPAFADASTRRPLLVLKYLVCLLLAIMVTLIALFVLQYRSPKTVKVSKPGRREFVRPGISPSLNQTVSEMGA
jgi:hypothetical protein